MRKVLLELEHYKISELLKDPNVYTVLVSNLYDYSDEYIVVNRTIDSSTAAANQNDKAEKDIASKNNALFGLFT